MFSSGGQSPNYELGLVLTLSAPAGAPPMNELQRHFIMGVLQRTVKELLALAETN